MAIVVPVGFLIAGLALTAVSAGVGTWQAVEARNAAADEADAIAEQKDKEALAARESAAFAEQQHRRRMAILAGKQAAVTAAAGGPLTGASALHAEIDLNTQTELEALQLRRGGQIESQAKSFEARLARYRAESQRGAIKYDIASGVLSAASGATASYSQYKGYNRYSSKVPSAFTSQRSGSGGMATV